MYLNKSNWIVTIKSLIQNLNAYSEDRMSNLIEL